MRSPAATPTPLRCAPAPLGLHGGIRLDTWDDSAVRFDQRLRNELTSLRFLDGPHGALILGSGWARPTRPPPWAGARCGGGIACTWPARTSCSNGSKPPGWDNTIEAELRRLAHVQLLIIGDFCRQPLHAITTADFYELVVERHRNVATVLTANHTPHEWLALTG